MRLLLKLFAFSISFLLASSDSICQSAAANKRCQVIYSENVNRFEQSIQQSLNANSAKADQETVYQIPVVIHVIHQGEAIGEGFNVSEEQIRSQIRVMNEDFRRKPDTRGFNQHPDGADARIEFILAKSDPDGNATNGIVRVNQTNFDPPLFSGTMVGLGAYYSFWDPYQYLNIWSFPGVQDFGLGEAKFPISDLPGLEDEQEFVIPGIDSLHGIPVKDIDGIAINAVHFGEVPIDTEYNLGRTGTHELGHFLGLFHIWGNEGFDGSCQIDDFCEDTPRTAEITVGCPTDKPSCDGTPTMIENYMDYANDACQNIFTHDQIQRMRAVLENCPRRKSLLTSDGLKTPEEVLASLQKPLEIQVYPNPFTHSLYLRLNANDGESIKVKYYDIAGIELGKEVVVFSSSKRVTLSPPNSKSAMLIVKIEQKNGQIALQKLVQN